MASPFSPVPSFDWVLNGLRRDASGIYRSWYFSQLLPIEGAHGTEGRFLAFVPYFVPFILRWRFIFSEVGRLVLSQLTIVIAFCDLHRCNGSILSSPISQSVLK